MSPTNVAFSLNKFESKNKAKRRYKTRGEKPPSDGEDNGEDMDTNDITCPLDGALNPERNCLETLIDNKGKKHMLQLRFAVKSDEKGTSLFLL